MNLLLNTHFLLWIVLHAQREGVPLAGESPPLGNLPGVLPGDSVPGRGGRLEVYQPGFHQADMADPRFVVDEPPLMALMEKALLLPWTRDPFDRLMAAHSQVRRIAFCSLDRAIRGNHRFLVEELRGEGEE